MQDIAGKVAFITGGASGIGLGMARVFLRNGMKVAIADLLRQHLDEVAQEFRGEPRVHLIELDVTDRPAMARAAEETLRVFGKVHVLCNNVGVSQRNPVATKFAIRGLTDSLRLALGPHKIGASVLCPGLTRTRAITAGDLYRGAHGGGAQPSESREAIGHGMDPEEVGERVLRAILRNEPYIFPHGEFKQEVEEYFEEMLAAFPVGQEADALRLQGERRRAQMTREARALADAIDR